MNDLLRNLAELAGGLHSESFRLFSKAGGNDWISDLRLGATAVLIFLVLLYVLWATRGALHR